MFLFQRHNVSTIGALSFAACFINASSLDNSMVHRSDLAREVRKAAEQLVQRHGFSTYSLPNKLTSQYQSAMDDAVQRLQQTAARRYDGYVSRIELDRVVETSMEAYLKNLGTIVMMNKISTQLTNHINHELAIHNLTQNDIPAHLVTDFTNAGNRANHRLNTLMTQDGRNYVRTDEIQKAVKEELASFIAQVKREQHTTSWNSVWNALGEWLNDDVASSPSSSTPSTPTTTTSPNVINSYHIEERASAQAASVARQKGIDAANLPAALVADYADRLSRVINRMRNIMSVYQRNSVYTHELEQAVAQEFATLSLPAVTPAPSQGLPSIHIDAAEECSICQDNFHSGQRVGILACNHVFHNECIYQWLTINPTCPNCRASAPRVAQQKVVA